MIEDERKNGSEGRTDDRNNNEMVESDVCFDDKEVKKPEAVNNNVMGKKEKKKGKDKDCSEKITETDADDVSALEVDIGDEEEEIRKVEEKMEALKDILLRRQADFENYKKRVIKDREEQKKLVIRDLALDIININDDLIRAVDAVSNIPKDEPLENAHQAFTDGVKMISKQIEDSLKKYGIVEIDSLNKEFDPNFNEAVEIDMSENVGSDTVTKIYQKGFMLDDLIIRSAKVKVTKPMKAKTGVGEQVEKIKDDFSDDAGKEVSNENVGFK